MARRNNEIVARFARDYCDTLVIKKTTIWWHWCWNKRQRMLTSTTGFEQSAMDPRPNFFQYVGTSG